MMLIMRPKDSTSEHASSQVGKQKRVNHTVRVDPLTDERIRRAVYHSRKTRQELILEGLSIALDKIEKEYDLPPFKPPRLHKQK